MAKKLTKKNFVNIDPSSIGKLKAPQLREILRGARQLYNAQSSTFKKYSDTVWSPALDKMNDYYDEKGKRNVSRMKMSDMRNEVFRLQEFFESDTSTVPGARKVMADQDRRIFGTDSKGRPVERMTLQQRTDFWAAYNEFISLESESYVRDMTSNAIQQYLGQIVLDAVKNTDDHFEFDMGTFHELRIRLAERQQQEEWERARYDFSSDLLSGKRSD